MEDPSVADVMDMNEYLIDDWEFDYSPYGETNDLDTKLTQNNNWDPEETTDKKRQGFALVSERPTKQRKQNNSSNNNNNSNSNSNNNNNSNSSSSPSSSSSSPSPTSQLISFGDQNVSPAFVDALNFSDMIDVEQFQQSTTSKRKEPSGRRQSHLLKEHVIAERKRRQKLNERLIALSALLPNLKKADKATVLEDAIRHLKQLKERVKQLEEERSSTSKTMESIIFVKKSHLSVEADDSCSASLSSDEDYSGSQICREALPLVEARVSNNDLLIRIHCEKSKGCLGKILTAIEKLRLDVVNSFTLPFGNSTLDITILAKMDSNFSRAIKDVVKNIRSAIVE